MTDQHVPALYAVAPSLMAKVKAAVMADDSIDPADKVEIIESLQPLPHLKLKHPETIMTNEELDIMEETYADIPPMNWRNYGTWFGGAMVKPTTSESLEYCVENGTYFDAPNAYFIEGWEDGDCEATVIGTGEVPPLGDLPQYTLTEIWDEMFTNPNVTEIPQATFKPRPKRITPEEVLAICDRAETASAEEVNAAYYVLMINAPCWAFSENENEQRAFLIETREGPQS